MVDVQIIGDQRDLDQAHRQKSEYYSRNADLSEKIKQQTSCEVVEFTSATLSWRGVWSAESAEKLLRLGIISKSHLKVISSRVILGTYMVYNIFMRSTGRTTTGTRR